MCTSDYWNCVMIRLDRGSGNFYCRDIPNKRVALVNLHCDENLKAKGFNRLNTCVQNIFENNKQIFYYWID